VFSFLDEVSITLEKSKFLSFSIMICPSVQKRDLEACLSASKCSSYGFCKEVFGKLPVL